MTRQNDSVFECIFFFLLTYLIEFHTIDKLFVERSKNKRKYTNLHENRVEKIPTTPRVLYHD